MKIDAVAHAVGREHSGDSRTDDRAQLELVDVCDLEIQIGLINFGMGEMQKTFSDILIKSKFLPRPFRPGPARPRKFSFSDPRLIRGARP